MPLSDPCTRCEQLRHHLVIARVRDRIARMRSCPECGATIVPISFKVGAQTRSYLDAWLESLSPTPCPCVAGGPVARALTVFEPRRLLWVCATCGTGRWPGREHDGQRGAA